MRGADDLGDRIAEFLDTHHVMSLATCGPRGPHAVNLFYARDGFSLLWVSDRDSTHSTNIGASPQVSATIAPDYHDFNEICGVQIFGDAHRLDGAATPDNARRLLAARYPILQQISDKSILKRAYLRAEPYQLVPHRIVMIDNRLAFAHKETLDLRGQKR